MQFTKDYKEITIKVIDDIYNDETDLYSKISRLSQALELINEGIREEKVLVLKDEYYSRRDLIISIIDELNSIKYIKNMVGSIFSVVNDRYDNNTKSRNLAVKTTLSRAIVYINHLQECFNQDSGILYGEKITHYVNRLTSEKVNVISRLENALFHVFMKSEKQIIIDILHGKGIKEEVTIGDSWPSQLDSKEIKKKSEKIVQRILGRNLTESLKESDIKQVLIDTQSEIEIYQKCSRGVERDIYDKAHAVIFQMNSDINAPVTGTDSEIEKVLITNNVPLKVLIDSEYEENSPLKYRVVDTKAIITGEEGDFGSVNVYESSKNIDVLNEVSTLLKVISLVTDLGSNTTAPKLKIESLKPREYFDTDKSYYEQFLLYKTSQVHEDTSELIENLNLSSTLLKDTVKVIASLDLILPFYSEEAISNILDDYIESKAEKMADVFQLVNEKFPNADESIKAFLALFVHSFMSSPTAEAISLAIKPAIFMLQTHLGASGRLVLAQDSKGQYVLVSTLNFQHQVMYLNREKHMQAIQDFISLLPRSNENWKSVNYDQFKQLLDAFDISTSFLKSIKDPEPFLLRNHRFSNYAWDAIQESTMLKFNLIAHAFKKQGIPVVDFQEEYVLNQLVEREFGLSLKDKAIEMKELYYSQSLMEISLSEKLPFFQFAGKVINDPGYEFNVSDAESILIDAIALVYDFIPVFAPLARAINVKISSLISSSVIKNIRLVRVSKNAFLRAVAEDISDNLLRRSKVIPNNRINEIKTRLKEIHSYQVMKETRERLQKIQTLGLSGGAGSATVNKAFGLGTDSVILETVDWCYNGKGPVGKRVLDDSIPLPAQPEVFPSIIDEKIAIVRQADEPVSITGWRAPKTGRIHILDGQHRFIAASKLGIPVEVKLKKFGTVPTQVDWGNTNYSNGTPAKYKLKPSHKPVFTKRTAVFAAGEKKAIQNINIHANESLGSIGRPNKNYSTGAQLVNFAENLKAQNVSALLSLDSGMSSGEIVALKKQLSAKGIDYISNRTTYIKDFFSVQANTQPTSIQIDNIVSRIVDLIDENNGIVLVHCALGDGRSGMVKAAVLMKKMWMKNKPDSIENLDTSGVAIQPSILKEREVLSYPAVKENIDFIRESHPKAVERADDIQVLNQYWAMLNSEQF
ncbi:hypothetical protein DSB67_10005 [Vibrio campbellii]|uniref:protein-tyrosine phosphatase family protein n=1 Tax=Vibrio campbellii TaxID=680 RepID=UPI000DE2ACF0|nr:dual specificity protein phosphatase family protein [Vibrio campbellii]AXB31851.1 hypothetical protein DSB67_10005 [Vibrio campbellii]